ncbi:hypothetical protein A2V80_01795 [Candidatus Woesebacteria bacterium RBG_16_39_8b]|uniref:Uncharacterized protein n=1 Tax=Candidatus Woesebacteria bacterium RBG_16_39_8b TaxID=1802482 RepID=A0A1F7XCB0_9BACT|nr:MAG: hypothetical protein A2V80_01795 [Candidatus Woesebacteria bacterium RBG_16_39_8b]
MSAIKIRRSKKVYQTVLNSRGERREFKITWGLAEGYGATAKTHTPDEVVALIEDYLKNKAAGGESYLTGTVTTGVVVYAWPQEKGEAGSGHEPNAVYSGEVSPLYNSGLSDEFVGKILDEMAGQIGGQLGQTRVYVAFGHETWVLQKEDTATPTGETV